MVDSKQNISNSPLGAARDTYINRHTNNSRDYPKVNLPHSDGIIVSIDKDKGNEYNKQKRWLEVRWKPSKQRKEYSGVETILSVNNEGIKTIPKEAFHKVSYNHYAIFGLRVL